MSDLLRISLSAAVPLHIEELKQRGGPNEAELAQAREASRLVAEKGDRLMFRGKKAGESAQVFNALAFGLAVLSFCPGGVTFLGDKWEAKL